MRDENYKLLFLRRRFSFKYATQCENMKFNNNSNNWEILIGSGQLKLILDACTVHVSCIEFLL